MAERIEGHEVLGRRSQSAWPLYEPNAEILQSAAWRERERYGARESIGNRWSERHA
jgi:hypothetical protein